MPSASAHGATPGRSRGRDGWRRGAAAGTIVANVALGLRLALEEPEEGSQLVREASGEAGGPAVPLELHFDPAGPAQTWAVVRPWLLPDGTETP